MDILFSLSLIILATFIVAKACSGFEVAADYIGRNLSDGVKGASINAIGSSMPELFSTFVFLFIFAETTGFAGGMGTTAGSAVFNVLIIPAASILTAIKVFKITGVKVDKKVVLRDGLMLIIAELILLIIITKTLYWWHGILLMLLYVVYFGFMFMTMKNTTSQKVIMLNNSKPARRLAACIKLDLREAIVGNNLLQTNNSWVLLSISTIIIALACYLLVYGCELFGHAIGMHGYFVAVILVAVASSMPDTILSVKDAKKGNYNDAISNALGSNIFDICFALGLPLFIYTLIYGPINIRKSMVEYILELQILLLLITIFVFFIFYFSNKIGKTKVFLLLILYALFAAYTIARAYQSSWIQPITENLYFIQQTITKLSG